MAGPPHPLSQVLVVDDSAVVRHVVRTALVDHGYTVTEAEDGAAALELLAGQRPAVILLDIEMPRLDGLSTLARLRADPALDGVPVILLTAHSDPDQVVEGLDHGAHDYLTKPFVAEELVARVRAAARTAELFDRLARRNQELDHFSAKAAHDLKSPLTVIKGNADILEMGWDRLAPEVRVEQLKAMAKASVRAASMIDDLLALARFDATTAGEPAATDTRAVLDGVLAAARLGEDEQVRVEGDYGEVVTPAPDLEAALRNLVENARHYGRSTDGILRLAITGSIGDGEQRIEVVDDGPGIPPTQAARIFDAFYALPGSRQRNASSTGVGLSIVKRALERWGGSATVDPEERQGARFLLSIPLTS